MAEPMQYPEPEPNAAAGRVYEDDLNNNYRWAFNEGGLHFENASRVHKAMHKIALRLDELNVSYAVVGAMALFHHGLRRFTEDIDLLVAGNDLKTIHDNLEGSGYRPPFANSKNLRDTELGVRIEFLVAGEFPGDGKPKPVVFPLPEEVAEVADGVRYVNLVSVIELKLASGLTNPGRLQDLADVQNLIKHARLEKTLSDKLNPYVREKYLALWEYAQIDRATHDDAVFSDE
jgi:hypothetical protein